MHQQRNEERAHGSRDRQDSDKFGPDRTTDILTDHHALSRTERFKLPVSQGGVTERLHREGSDFSSPDLPQEGYDSVNVADVSSTGSNG